MSTAEILSLISTISFVVAAIAIALAIFFWFAFKIPTVIGDLSGRTAKKSIARMRANNERAGGQGYRPSAANVNRGKLTDTMQHSKKPTGEFKKKSAAATKQKAAADNLMPETGVLESNKATAVMQDQTALLDDRESTSLLIDEDATAPLNEERAVIAKRTGGIKMQMLDEIMLIHTDEVI